MNDSTTTMAQLRDMMRDFVQQREWQVKHTSQKDNQQNIFPVPPAFDVVVSSHCFPCNRSRRLGRSRPEARTTRDAPVAWCAVTAATRANRRWRERVPFHELHARRLCRPINALNYTRETPGSPDAHSCAAFITRRGGGVRE